MHIDTEEGRRDDMATYPQWCCSMDVTDDMRYVAINDDDEIIYCIDREGRGVSAGGISGGKQCGIQWRQLSGHAQ